MSINDILSSDTFIPMCMIFFVVIMAIAVPIGIKAGKQTNNDIYGNDETGETKTELGAKIIALRNSPHPLNKTVLIDKVVFQLTNGERIEFAINDKTLYSTFIDGDIGELKYRGKQFIEFKRNI